MINIPFGSYNLIREFNEYAQGQQAGNKECPLDIFNTNNLGHFNKFNSLAVG